MKELVNSRS